jgi:hypothetical protein
VKQPCDRIDAYFDGELSVADARAFREHLGSCRSCPGELLELAKLEALVGSHAEALRAGPGSGAARVVVPIAVRSRRRGPVPALAAFMALAAAAAWVLVLRPPGASTGPAEGSVALIESPTRSLEARLAYGDADHFRPYDVARSASSTRGEHASLEALARLEKRRDFEGVAAGMVLGNDLDRADEYLARAGESPELDVDRAVVLMQRGKLEDALDRLAPVLDASPANGPALWDQALVLRDLHLDLAAADDFEKVAALGEPGWADEARARARALRDAFDDRVQTWRAAKKAGRAMVDTGAQPPAELVRRYPSYLARYLYHALRSSPSRERALALLPLAITLDGADPDAPLARAVQRMATGDFGRRGPLAEEYGRLFEKWIAFDFDDATIDSFLTRARAAHEDDLFFGAVDMTGRAGLHATELAAIAAARHDPWMDLVARGGAAAAQQGRGDFASSETTLRSAIGTCNARHLDYLCAKLELQLVQELVDLARTADATAVAESGLRRSRLSAHDQGYNLEAAMADVARQRGAFPLMAAYLRDTVLREPNNCVGKRQAYEFLAAARLRAFDPAGARDEFEQSPVCDAPIAPLRVLLVDELTRLEQEVPEQEALAAEIARARPTWSPADRAQVDAIEGAARIERDPEVGAALLQSSLDAVSKLPRGDTVADKARAYAHLMLALDAARRGRGDEALDQMVADAGASTDTRCSLAVGVDNDRSFAVTRGAAGEAIATFEAHRPSPAIDPSQLVPAEVRARLAGCPSVQVFAPAPVHGTPSLLPDEIAWSYRIPGARGVEAGGAAPHRVLVSDVDVPPSLGLPRLQPWRGDADPSVVWLHGSSATPARVVAELRDATEVEIHAHGLVDLATSDASLVVLSPDADGRYALTARDIRATRLDGHPIVVLAACSAARVAPYYHEPWSLPLAFVAAGARAVLASPAPVDDAEAGPFFQAVLGRIRRGQPPAEALRDERVARLGDGANPWIRQVLLFD